MVGPTAAAADGLNYSVEPSVMQIELARTKYSKCMIKFLCGRRSLRQENFLRNIRYATKNQKSKIKTINIIFNPGQCLDSLSN
jgi:hypothetical protein